MTKFENVLMQRRIKAQMGVIALLMTPKDPAREEAIHILEEYTKLMEKPIDPNHTRGRIV